MSRTTSCTVMEREQMENILRRLKWAGFSSHRISVLFPHRGAEQEVIQEKQGNLSEGVGAGMSIGGVIGGIIGWLAGIGIFAIPGMGAFVAAGPLMAALSGTAIGAACGGLSGILMGFGLPEYEVKIYENKLKEGWTLISVQTEDEETEKRELIRQIFKTANASDVSDIKFVFKEHVMRKPQKQKEPRMKKCSEVMTKIPRCCFPGESIEQVAQVMKMEDVGSLPVLESTESHQLIGIVTDRDIALKVAAEGADPSQVKVYEIMTPNPVVCHEEDDIQVALEAMAQHQIRRIPVVDDAHCIVGIIAQGDMAMRVHEPEKTAELLREISKPHGTEKSF